MSISSDGWTLLSGGRDGVVIMWNLRDYSKVATIPVFEAVEGILCLDYVELPSNLRKKKSKDFITQMDDRASLNTIFFATGGEKGIVKVWRSDTGECIFDRIPHGVGTPTAAGAISELIPLSHNRLGLIAATQDCRLLFFSSLFGNQPGSEKPKRDAKSPKQKQSGLSCMLNLERQLIGNNDEITDLRFVDASPQDDEKQSSTAGNVICEDNKLLPTYIAVATNSEHIRLFETSNLSCVGTLDGHEGIVLSLDTLKLNTGQTLLASGAKDDNVRVWTVPQGRCIAVGSGHVGAVGCVAFSTRPNGGFLVSGCSDKLLKVWDTGSLLLDVEIPETLKTTAAVAAHEKDINAVAVAPNDSIVASASQDRTVKIWRMPDLSLLRTLRGHKRGVWSLAFSPIDQAIATSSGDKTVKLWALKDGSCLRTFEGHLTSVLRVQFLSSGTQLVTAGGDGLLKLWNVRDTECINTFDAHEDKVWALSLSDKKGDFLASGGGDGSLVVWEDCTSADASDARLAAETTILQEQDLSNAVKANDWVRAASLAFEMQRPGKLLSVFNSAFDARTGGLEMGWKVLSQVLSTLSAQRLKECLEYCREWNAHSRTCFIAQATLYTILKVRPPHELSTVPGIALIIDGLLAYTQRHFKRSDRILRSTFIIDHLMDSINLFDRIDEENLGQIGHDQIFDDQHTGVVQSSIYKMHQNENALDNASGQEHENVQIIGSNEKKNPNHMEYVEQIGNGIGHSGDDTDSETNVATHAVELGNTRERQADSIASQELNRTTASARKGKRRRKSTTKT